LKETAMTTPAKDQRSAARRAQDENIAAEPLLQPLDLPAEAATDSLEAHLARQTRNPVAIAGIVENGVVRPLDPTVNLPEKTRVIIVASLGA
jgi:hypothetical protein